MNEAILTLPVAWQNLLQPETEKLYFKNLQAFLSRAYQTSTVYPPLAQVFSALELTSPEAVKVVILGQDPYHGAGQAHGLSFSVQDGVKLPPSLKNIYKELHSDLGIFPSQSGNLTAWAKQGVLMLNAVLTVQAVTPNSHKNQGWEHFTDAVLTVINQTCEHVVFVLWGAYAAKKAHLIAERHSVVVSAHPSPFSAHTGFFGSKPFSAVNQALQQHAQSPIDWRV